MINRVEDKSGYALATDLGANAYSRFPIVTPASPVRGISPVDLARSLCWIKASSDFCDLAVARSLR